MKGQLKILFDYDSFIYKSVYKIVSDEAAEKWEREKRTKDWIDKEVVILATNRITQMETHLFEALENCGLPSDFIVEYFITATTKSIRKRLYPSYKASRKRKNLDRHVSLVRKAFATKFAGILDQGFASNLFHYDDEWEADDLIHDRAKQLGEDHCVICTLDKDLVQIGGLFFDYYLIENQDEKGNPIINQYGKPSKTFRGLKHVSQLEAKKFFWYQMLAGDGGDDIDGCKGIGPETAKELLEGLKIDQMEALVKDQYKRIYKDRHLIEYNKNHFLLKLGVRPTILD